MKHRRFPYGYEMIDAEIVICDFEATIVKNIFNDYISGKSLKDIADSLTLQGIEYLSGVSTWNKNHIHRIIEDKRYFGDDVYPKIIDKETKTTADLIKSGRRISEHAVCSENRFLAHVAFCAKCGQRLYHKTDIRSKSKETWYCTNSDCKASYNLTIESLENEVVAILNRIIFNPILADKNENTQNSESQIKIKQIENEIERSLDKLDFDKFEIQNLILKCAAERYESICNQQHITDRLKADFAKSSPLFSYNAEFFRKTVASVIFSDDGIWLQLKNGNLVGKDQICNDKPNTGNAEDCKGYTA